MANGRQTATGISMPAPVNGWNARDPWPNMRSDEAIQLDNLFPEFDGVRLRKGYQTHATGTGSVLTLHSYRYGASSKLLAFSNGNIWDVTAAGTAISLSTGLGTGIWSVVNFGAYAIMVNGVDTPRKFDGTTVTTTTFTGTGLTATNLFGVAVFKNRLYLWENNSLAFWYGGNQAIAGTLTKFDLSFVAALGGKIVAISSWTIDAGDGVDDAFVVLLSTGQVVIYQGTDPGTDFAITGIFQIGGPISPRGTVKFGGDLIIITADGYLPLSKSLPLGRTNDSVSISDKISGAVKEATRLARDSFGWQAVQYPKGGWLLFNVPTNQGAFEQHVMNTRTGAWCRFVGQPSQCWAVHEDELYFGGTDRVNHADTGTSDNGSLVQFDMRTAFSQMTAKGRQKRWTATRPTIRVNGKIPIVGSLSTDYETREPAGAISSTEVPGGEWDVAIWDVDFWAPPFILRQSWETISGLGFTSSLWLRGATATQELAIFGIDYLVEPGGYL